MNTCDDYGNYNLSNVDDSTDSMNKTYNLSSFTKSYDKSFKNENYICLRTNFDNSNYCFSKKNNSKRVNHTDETLFILGD